ncbi:protein HID1, partial [Salvelinus sp. IW2-2015]|uniref:protein HID1 n=1 Tax=Salvelinus sp. IW2-2015 TaxID=2691554 RepID=UPI0038D4F76F
TTPSSTPVSFFCPPNPEKTCDSCPLSTDLRHALPLFTSLVNVVCAYDPVGYGIPYNHLLFSDYREQLVEQAVQILIVTLEHDGGGLAHRPPSPSSMEDQDSVGPDNLFVNYLSRIHREEDYDFVLKGLARLLVNPLMQTYLPNSTKKIQFHQELLVLFWKLCDFNKKFLFFVLKKREFWDILVPILFYLNDARGDQSRWVSCTSVSSSWLTAEWREELWGVRFSTTLLQSTYLITSQCLQEPRRPAHSSFHKIITSGHQRLQPLVDCLPHHRSEVGRVALHWLHLLVKICTWSLIYLFNLHLTIESPIEIHSLFYKRGPSQEGSSIITAFSLHYSVNITAVVHYSVTALRFTGYSVTLQQ